MKSLLTACLFPALLAVQGSELLQTAAEINGVRRSGETPLDFVFDLDGTVTATADGPGFLFTDNSAGTILRCPDGTRVSPGDRVRLAGFIHLGYRPTVTNATVLGRTSAPKPRDATISGIRNGEYDYKFVRIRGLVIDAARDEISPDCCEITLAADGKTIVISTSDQIVGTNWISRLLGAQVTVTGMCDPRVGGQRLFHRHGIVAKATDIVQSDPLSDPFAAGNVEDLRYFDYEAIGELNERQSIVGTVAAVWDENNVLVASSNGWKSQVFLAKDQHPPRVGQRIRAVGFPVTDVFSINLSAALWKEESGPVEPDPPPVDVTAKKLLRDGDNANGYRADYHRKVVRIRGNAVSVPSSPLEDQKILLESEHAVIPIDVKAISGSLGEIDAGCQLEVAGVCMLETEILRSGVPFPRAKGIRIIVRRPSDIVILSQPPWWTPTRLYMLTGTLTALLLALLIWNLVLKKLIDRRSRQLLKEQIAHVGSELRVEERTRLAVELHDTLSQNLAGASMRMLTVRRLFETDPGKALVNLDIASKTLLSCREEMRNCIWDLRNQALDEPDLNVAVSRTLHQCAEDVDLTVQINVPRSRLTDNTAHTLLRIIRELTSNAVRHGQATSVSVTGDLTDNAIVLTVRDNGTGFDPSACGTSATGHFGLQGIRERIRPFDGEMRIDSSARETTVLITLRLPPSKELKDNHGQH